MNQNQADSGIPHDSIRRENALGLGYMSRLALISIDLLIIFAFSALVVLLVLDAVRVLASPFGLMILAWAGLTVLQFAPHH
jgi:hypothetical protein